MVPPPEEDTDNQTKQNLTIQMSELSDNELACTLLRTGGLFLDHDELETTFIEKLSI